MSIDTNIKCFSCERELIYSIPKEEDDTTTKNKIDAGWYQCLICAKEAAEAKKQAAAQKREEKKRKQEAIKDFQETKTQVFKRQWDDVDENRNSRNSMSFGHRIVDLPLESERLMATYKVNNTRKAADGFLTKNEMTNVIRAEQIREIILNAQRQEQEVNNMIHDNPKSRPDGEKRLKDIEENKHNQLKKQATSLEREISKANKDQERLPLADRERLVTDPAYRDPEGNKAPRYFLLSDNHTYERRSAERDRRIQILNDVDEIEKAIAEKNQRHFDEITGQVTE